MIWNGLFINSVSAYLPQRISLSHVKSATQVDATNFGFETVSKSDQSESVMAGLAAKKALEQSDHANECLSTIVYASTVLAVDHFTPACYLQRMLGQHDALAFQLNAASNGGMMGVEVTARLLSADSSSSAGLLSAVSRIPDGMDRWNGGTLNGDGAVAAVVSKTGGFARLVASQTKSNAEFEVLSRNLATRPGDWYTNYSEANFLRYVDSYSLEVALVISATLAEINISMEHMSHVVLPAVPLTVSRALYLERNSIPIEKTCWPELRRNGHVGPCDQLLGLTYLKDTHRLEPGQFVLMVGVGLGFQCTCILLKIV